jgi:hypothetical protein
MIIFLVGFIGTIGIVVGAALGLSSFRHDAGFLGISLAANVFVSGLFMLAIAKVLALLSLIEEHLRNMRRETAIKQTTRADTHGSLAR